MVVMVVIVGWFVDCVAVLSVRKTVVTLIANYIIISFGSSSSASTSFATLAARVSIFAGRCQNVCHSSS